MYLPLEFNVYFAVKHKKIGESKSQIDIAVNALKLYTSGLP